MTERRYRVLVTDEVDPEGVAILRAHPDIEVVEKPTRPLTEVLEEIGTYDAFIGRSATRVTREFLQAGERLRIIGRAGVGVDNVDLPTATELGIAVINAPGGNTVSVAELAFGVLIGLARHVPVAAESMRAGRWDRSKLGGIELRGKTMAIIGVGRIGGEMARRARAFGMQVIGYDPYIAAPRFEELAIERVERLNEALERADVLTVHVPLNNETRGMIGAPELSRMGRQAFVLNLARGGVVAEDALADALTSGRIAGAAVDAFDHEPLPVDSPLRAIPNLILTPHLGASTTDAQRNVAVEACEAVRDALVTGDLSAAMNSSGVGGAATRELRPLLLLADRLGRLGRALVPGALSSLEVRYTGPRENAPRPLLLSALQGALRDVVERRAINLVNAQHVAAERGIETAWAYVEPRGEQGEEIELRLEGGERSIRVGGALLGETHGRIIRIGGFRVDVAPRGVMMVIRNRDVPGVIGRVGTLLGEAGVNIAEYHQARLQIGGEALAAVSVDSRVPANVVDALCTLSEILEVRQVEME
ncbi:phosphoglycerate dehydrogenase [Longimicrobium terrae]|uniref:D-3-phosphoglycerate dehydrogenase n=1 Tax=Longimicrobium terrae TaxID=1639882 RepID=A0A841H143_9BACT|nr:phosphoglycerate dehydrogenase [Longimicrobium terrae]MBB4637325.1 D-3-phosphoglycerate dehydrogenase [Longimicrobium terrae]MBB6071723.1 D-3-phosphoglycerate dehydrogenase [Longimicrobium terrae]NNC28484.1 phosphoglycerate dehydrogenase [Longimicrobium terrae]